MQKSGYEICILEKQLIHGNSHIVQLLVNKFRLHTQFGFSSGRADSYEKGMDESKEDRTLC